MLNEVEGSGSATVAASLADDAIEGICNAISDNSMRLGEQIGFATEAASRSGWEPPTLEAKRLAGRLHSYALFRTRLEPTANPERLQVDAFAEPLGGLILVFDFGEKRLTARIPADGSHASVSEVDEEGFQLRTTVEREADLHPLVRWLVRTA